MLEPLGLSGVEEAVYRQLLREPTSQRALAERLEQRPGQVRAALQRLRDLGLVSRAPGRAGRYVAAPPDAALRVLLDERANALEEARVAAARFTEELRTARRDRPDELVEVVTDQASVHQRFLQLQHAAREQIRVFDKPPYAGAAGAENELEKALLARGIRYRTIIDAALLEHPGVVDDLQVMAALGEEARVMPGLPMKLAIADRRMGLLPLRMDRGVAESAIVVHPSTLLDALVTLFESLWERAAPLGRPQAGLPDTDREVLQLLTLGLQDQAIAHRLDVGVRTVGRRVQQLLTALGARTRFQAGVLATRRGWLEFDD